MVKNRKLLAEQLVEESVVLLKNENQLLPLQEIGRASCRERV